MVQFTANDLRNLATMLGQFDKMVGPFKGETGFTTQAGKVVNVQYHFDTELDRHVVTFLTNTGQ